MKFVVNGADVQVDDRLTPDELADPVHPYIRIHEDGAIVAYSSQIEMGQGIHTGLATIVAEELDADFATFAQLAARAERLPVPVAPALGNAIAALTGAASAPSRSPRPSGSPEKGQRMPDVTITPSVDGPYIVSGPVVLTAPDGRVIEHPDPMSICRCGGSSNKPFCDGTHTTIDFDGTLAN